jgi:hypothetical protein
MDNLRYPIGKFTFAENLSEKEREQAIAAITEAPANLRAAVSGLSNEQLETPYRPDGWTVRQVVHHVFDSHLNSYTRFRLALTEDEPLIKPYDEAAWAELTDAKTAPIEVSLTLLEALHTRWVMLLNSLSPSDWQRTFRHPELGVVSLEKNVQLYAWHGKHHVAHINNLRQRENWQ